MEHTTLSTKVNVEGGWIGMCYWEYFHSGDGFPVILQYNW